MFCSPSPALRLPFPVLRPPSSVFHLPSSILATSPARLYQLGVSDDMTHSAQQGYRRHRRRRLRRFFRVLLAALLFTALVYLTLHLFTRSGSPWSPGLDVSDDSAVQFK